MVMFSYCFQLPMKLKVSNEVDMKRKKEFGRKALTEKKYLLRVNKL